MKILEFTAAWCSPCKSMKPKVEEECKKVGCDLEVIDIEQEDDLVNIYKIRNVPTLIAIDDEKNVIGRASGNDAYEHIAVWNNIK